jgi:hypothetical protein
MGDVMLSQVLRPVVTIAAALIACAIALAADDSRPVVGPGASKEDVISAYGWPNGQSHSGTKEILNYAQGDVVLENGRVERVNFSPDVPWQTPRPRPAAPTASTRKVPDTPVDYWLTNYDEAIADAERRHSRILILFTGSDWSPASREFHEQVEFHPDFVNAFAGDFVFVKLDYPRGAPVPAKISDENLKLRDKYSVTTYPTLLVLAPNGDTLSRVELSKPNASGTFRERVIAAVREARDGTAAGYSSSSASEQPIAPAPAPAAVAPIVPTTTPTTVPAAASVTTESAPIVPVKTPSGSSQLAGGDNIAGRVVWTAGRLVALGLAAGGAVILAIWWKLTRQAQPKTAVPVMKMAERIDAAAGGLPTATEIGAWSKEKLTAVVAGLAEFDNYTAHVRPLGGDADIELRKRGDVNPRVLACCVPGIEGVVAAKRVRELFGTLAAEGVDNGWYVSPAGFSAEARDYAAAHRIMLIGCEGLHNMMREVPPVSLPALLARG